MSEDGETMSTGEAAKILKVNAETVRRYIDRGWIKAERTFVGPGGHRRPYRASVEAYRRKMRGEPEPGGETPPTESGESG